MELEVQVCSCTNHITRAHKVGYWLPYWIGQNFSLSQKVLLELSPWAKWWFSLEPNDFKVHEEDRAQNNKANSSSYWHTIRTFTNLLDSAEFNLVILSVCSLWPKTLWRRRQIFWRKYKAVQTEEGY